MKIHETLRVLRKKIGFTQKEILTDVDPSVYSRIESKRFKKNNGYFVSFT